MKLFRHGFCGLALIGAALCAADAPVPDPLPPNASTVKPGGWVFSLVPKSLQARPQLDFNVITEMTPEGKRLPLPSPEHPVYYVEQTGRMLEAGNGPGNKRVPAVADLEAAMKKALSVNGYLPETPEHRAALVVVFSYGSHESMADNIDGPPPGSAEEFLPYIENDLELQKELIDRAGLVGGSKFVHELAQAFEQEVANARMNYETKSNAAPVSPDPASPYQMFARANPQLSGIIEDAFMGCYFVVASAYDYQAVSQNQRLLYWRTKMTVSTTGISMEDSLPPLIASAAPYFGRPMLQPEIISRRVDRQGKVDVGAPRVVPDVVSGDKSEPAEPPKAP